MKRVIFTALFLIVLGSAWMLYLEYSNKRFVENLPKVRPTSTLSVNTNTENTESGNSNITDVDSVLSETVPDNSHAESEHVHPHTDMPELTVEEMRVPIEVPLAELEELQNDDTTENFESPEPMAEEYVRARETLERIYMNPENWLKGRRGKVGSILGLTYADALAAAEAYYLLYPTEEHKIMLEITRKLPMLPKSVTPPPNLEEDYEAIPLKRGYTLYRPK
ncbi:MAG: hypothetical protein OXN27_06410 [Candidatus Poribacteria bacterium]|nr:hypothetical protein [Candidatus Poribacteria bacterium]MDE0323540.1 hypothetical protein [Candidatus Poribacteria bacterium]